MAATQPGNWLPRKGITPYLPTSVRRRPLGKEGGVVVRGAERMHSAALGRGRGPPLSAALLMMNDDDDDDGDDV